MKLRRNGCLPAKQIDCSISNQISFKRPDYSLNIPGHVHPVNAEAHMTGSPWQGQQELHGLSMSAPGLCHGTWTFLTPHSVLLPVPPAFASQLVAVPLP